MEFLDLLWVDLHMTAFDTAQLDDEVGGLEVLPNFYIDCTRYSISSVETFDVVVKVNVDGTFEVQI